MSCLDVGWVALDDPEFGLAMAILLLRIVYYVRRKGEEGKVGGCFVVWWPRRMNETSWRWFDGGAEMENAENLLVNCDAAVDVAMIETPR